jgi:hypothetical protein
MVAVRTARAARKRIVGLGHAAGFSAAELKARLEEMREDPREQEERLEREAKHRRWLGIIRPDQPKLGLGGEAPEEIRDEAYWKARGFLAGLRRLAATPPDGIPERFVQAWLAERARGAAEVPADHGEPETVAQQAAREFAEDNPDAVLERGASEPDEAFEATEDELQQQGARRAVQESREAEDVT